MSETMDKHVIKLLPAHALGILGEDEAHMVNSHLAECSQCRQELNDYQQVVEHLPLAAPQKDPSPQLKSQLMRRVAGTKTDETEIAEDGTMTDTSRSVSAAGQRTPGSSIGDAIRAWLAGPVWRPVALILIVILLAGNVFLLLDTTSEPDSPAIQPTFPWRRPVVMAGTELAPEAVGILYISVDGVNGTLVVDGLPVLAADQQYQLWLNTEEVKDSGAVFSVNEAGYRGIELESPLPLENYETFGITIEPVGGSLAPTGERVLVYTGQETE